MTDRFVEWGLVCAEDEIFSAKTKRWYTVTAVRTSGVTTTVYARDVPKPFIRPASESVRVRRGVTGRAVDMFVQVLSSE
jgi:hypothetical protein